MVSTPQGHFSPCNVDNNRLFLTTHPPHFIPIVFEWPLFVIRSFFVSGWHSVVHSMFFKWSNMSCEVSSITGFFRVIFYFLPPCFRGSWLLLWSFLNMHKFKWIDNFYISMTSSVELAVMNCFQCSFSCTLLF